MALAERFAQRTTATAVSVASFQAVDASPPGAPLTVSWATVAGATEVEVDPAVVTISPAVDETSLGALLSTEEPDESGWRVTVPEGVRIRALTLSNLRLNDDTPIDEVPSGSHLVVATVDANGAVAAPLCAVPPVPKRGLLPQSLTGASFGAGVLRLPDVAAAKLKVSLVSQDFPEQFEPQSIRLDGVTATGAVLPRDVKLVEPDGTTAIWAFPGEWPANSPAVTPDLRVSIKRLFQAALKAGQPLSATFRVVAQQGGQVFLTFAAPTGALLRTFPGNISAVLTADPVALPLSGTTLADEPPTGVSGDVTVTYTGLRLLEDLSDPLPVVAGGVAGVIVGTVPVQRGFPPGAFATWPLARVGLIGRAPEPCELSVQFADAAGTRLGTPGVVKPAPSTVVGTIWADLPAMPEGATSISVVATTGRFLWATGDAPLIRFVVRDSDPGGRAVTLGGTAIVLVGQPRQTIRAAALPAAVFHGAAPVLSSSLLVTVVLSNLTLRYAR